MDPILFPDIDPVAFSLGALNIRWYALAYLAGFLLGWAYILKLASLDENQPPTRLQVDGFVPWAVFGVILGGRIGYILFYNFSYFAEHPLEIFRIWEGGMSFHGGMIGVILAIIFYARHHNISILAFGDLIVCTVPIGLFFGRLANFANAELYGRITDAPWGVVFPYGGNLPRHPSQLYEAALEGLLIFVVLAICVRNPTIRKRHGILAGLFLLLYGLARSFVEFYREPDAHIGYLLGPVTMGHLLSLPMILVGGGLICYARRTAKSD